MSKHVIFGTGPLGRSTAEYLVADGHEVILVNRSGTLKEGPAGVVVAKANLLEGAGVRRLLQGAEVAYFCAQPAYHRWVAEFPALQASLVEACLDTKTALVAAENLYGYGKPQGPLTEQHPVRPCSRKGRLRANMSAELVAAQARGLKVAMVRGSDFFGPWDHSNGLRLLGTAWQGKPVFALGRLDQPHSFTYTKDFGRLLALVGQTPSAWGRAWHVPSGEPLTQAELFRQVGEALGRPVKVKAAGGFLLGLIGLFDPVVRELPEILYEFNQPFVIDGSEAEKAFGLRATPMTERIRETLAWVQTELSGS